MHNLAGTFDDTNFFCIQNLTCEYKETELYMQLYYHLEMWPLHAKENALVHLCVFAVPYLRQCVAMMDKHIPVNVKQTVRESI